jgi:hypothetical protein
VEGCHWGAVLERRCQGVGRLRVLLRARLQPPGGRILPRPAVLLPAGAGTSCS